MGKLIRHTHTVLTNKIACEVNYTLQGKLVELKAEIDADDLTSINTATVCAKLSQIMGMTVTV